ncbi:hypothetical protein ACSMXN_06290 [Jatrophihabitans sp. DSM 45814]
MVDASALDVTIVVVVVALRVIVPLLIPRFPLPAILAALVIDGVDQTVFQSWLSASTWAQLENGYQGYDKALDVFYLTIAYTATMRNWKNPSALRWAQFLWLYRLVGVTTFEILHNASAPESWRWLLLVFPNTFEYFFIAYEAIRLRWDPRRLSPRSIAALVAFIWIFIKLPQEWWIHVARLDFTDFASEHGWVVPTIVILVIVVVAVGWWAIKYRLPPADWAPKVTADALPADLGTDAQRGAYRAQHWRLFDWNLVEKVVLVSLVCEIFAQILPGSTATLAQVSSAVAILVIISSAVGLAFVRRGRSIENAAAQFISLCLLNAAILGGMRLLSSRFELDHALFFILLVSLIVFLYDRYCPIREETLQVEASLVPATT